MHRRIIWLVLMAASLTGIFGSGRAVAQTEGETVVVEQAPAEPAKKKTKAAAAAAPAAGGDVGDRLDQLERQLLDMQVVIGTLESLARGRGSAALPASGGGDAAASGDVGGRLAILETQIQAISAQLQEVVQRLDATPAGTPLRQGAVTAPAGLDPAAVSTPPVSLDAGVDWAAQGAGIVPEDLAAAGGAATTEPQTAALGGSPEQAYETAYGHVLEQDFTGAATAFNEFLRLYPDDALAGNAKFWLGESYYRKGDYKQAADAFLKGYSQHKKGQKAPESLLKLAMSLGRLGQNDAACQAFGALDAQYPNAPQQVKKRAQAERQRTGC